MKLRRLALALLGCASIALAGTTTATASTLADFLPAEVVALIPSGSADSVAPFLPPLPAPLPAPAPQAAPAPAPVPAPAPPVQAKPNRTYKNCAEARNAGVTPIYRGEAGYAAHLDRDNDGIACEN
ncbi:excalibur calcium-binding domain-containing protein [Rhodococcus tukisamuensis]|uniref:Excalibur calcium-binding domain-containing protein n=1 Tax=Rhodococcus tukisamuensis TaxID=168276 RepID=A0A1G7CGI1_9NOCA|nr:excalibur calcium-binding domain-containing protein [Rhodococcus tukisamuensis]SDE38448.1 Excalibur calcium-binding domain-containing protein [Rhodococcus tukisamuensis]